MSSRGVNPLVAGVDVGGTKVLAGVVDVSGTVIGCLRRETPRPSQATDALASTIVELVEQLRSAHDLKAVGVGAAGFVDLAGTIRFAPHLSWRDEPLQSVLEERLGLPVVVDNDANTAARAEVRFGAGRWCQQALCITLGTGIGGAVVFGGEVVRGSQGFAGEFGHAQVVPGGRACECGHSGCWEQYCSGKALLRAASHDGRTDLTGPEVTAAAAAGEARALRAFEEVGAWLGIGLAGLVAALDPEIVIVGGGLSEAGELLLAPARETFSNRLPGRGFRAEPPIVCAHLGPAAGFIGAADLARALTL